MQLKSRLIAEQAQTHGNASWQALGAVLAGWLGKKTGRGFYDYRGETPVPTR